MKPQLLAMNLISERPDPSGTPAQCRDRFMKAMYPNSSNPFTSAAQTAQVQHAKSAEAPQLPSAQAHQAVPFPENKSAIKQSQI